MLSLELAPSPTVLFRYSDVEKLSTCHTDRRKTKRVEWKGVCNFLLCLWRRGGGGEKGEWSRSQYHKIFIFLKTKSCAIRTTHKHVEEYKRAKEWSMPIMKMQINWHSCQIYVTDCLVFPGRCLITMHYVSWHFHRLLFIKWYLFPDQYFLHVRCIPQYYWLFCTKKI